jgi:hypothetical protein
LTITFWNAIILDEIIENHIELNVRFNKHPCSTSIPVQQASLLKTGSIPVTDLKAR